MATVNESKIARAGLDPITVRTLDAFRRRRGLLLLMRAIGVGLLVFVSLTLTLATADYLFFFSDAIRWTLSVSIYVATALAMWLAGFASFGSRDSLEIAKHVESVAPDLRENLVSAVELADPDSSNGSLYFRRLLQSRVARRISKVDVGKVLPLSLVRRWVMSGGSVAAICVAMMFIPSAQFGRRFARAALPGFAIERASNTKVTILEPSPPSRYVAERDAVGVIVRVLGAESDDVMLHWRSSDGTAGESIMTPRVDAAAFMPGSSQDSSNSDPSSDIGTAGDDALESVASVDQQLGSRFAANLSVGSVPLQYRITAGDAITLWHELTPLPRPRVVRYEKLYRLPAYAKLTDRTANEEHGDLKALQGTTAEVTVTFDQPVENPIVRFGVRGARSEMEPVDDSKTKFLARISIKTSGQYQVDATSIRSGLNNPFSPTNMITPVLDTPPVIRWSDDIKPSQMVSSLEVIELSAFAADDLPLDRIVHEIQVNNERFQSYALPIELPDRKLDLAWSWDLLNRLGESSRTPQLAAGDLVKTRVVAIDRRGARTESPIIEFLIAGDGFDADRHQFLETFSQQVTAVNRWADESKKLATTIKEMSQSGQYEALAEVSETWKSLQQESVALIKSHSDTLTATQNPASSSMTELVGRGVIDVETRLDGQIKLMQWLADHVEEDWARDHKKNSEFVKRESEQTAYQCERLSEFAQARFGLALTASLYSDVNTLRDGINRLVDDMPKQRVPRYLTLIAGQMKEIDRLIEQYEPLLDEQTAQHLAGDHWSRWSQRWNIQIETLLEDQARRDQIHAVLTSLRDEIKDKPQHVIHSGIHNTALRWGRDLRKEMLYLADLTQRVRGVGREWQNAKSAAERERNAQDAFKRGLDENWEHLRWQTELKRLIVRAAGQEKLNRAKSKVDLKYAADQNLFLRAIKNVTAEGYRDYDDEPADQVLNSVAAAIGVLQAVSDVSAAREDWLSISEGENRDDKSPIRKIYHPIWFKLQDTRIELGVRYLRQANLDWNAKLAQIDATRYNDDHNQANSRIDSRQWSSDPFISAAKPLGSLTRDLQLGLDGLAEKQEESRDVLRRYVLTLSQQAREAAEKAEQARQQTDQREDSSEQSAKQVRPEQDQAVDKATETIGALIDQANTSDLIDDEAREIARDADAAAELIAEAVKETKEAMKEAQSATATDQRNEALESVEEELGKLSQRLAQTAEHFEKIENGEDVSESREQLRRDEQQLQSADALDERYERADQMADTAKQDPRELLRQLEEELKRNEPMQDALSDISAGLVKEAAENLKEAAREEDALQRRLESEDDAFVEQKRQQQMMLDEFVARAKTLRDRTLNAASKAASWANEPRTREQVDAIRQQLSDSIAQAEQASRGQPTLDELQNAARQFENDVRQAAESTAQVSQQLDAAADKDLYDKQDKRDSTAKSMQQTENQLRNEEVHAIDQQRNKWLANERSAGQRINSAQQRKRQAESAIRREQDKLKKDPNNDWVKREIQRHQDLLDEAERTIEQTQQTKELADQRRKQAVERANAINDNKVTPLDRTNPAAQLGERVTRDAAERMQELAKEIGQLRSDSDIASDLRATSDSAENIARQQQSVKSAVQSAAEDLARASRHEQRLDNRPVAQQLAEASDQTINGAGQAAQNADDELRQSVDDDRNSDEAGRALRDASETIAAQAEAVESLLSQSQQQSSQPQQSGDPSQPSPSPQTSADATQAPSPSSGQPSQGAQAATGQQPPSDPSAAAQPSGSQPSPQQMAQTLDDLDRTLAAQSGQPGQPSEGQNASAQSSQGAEGQPSSGQPGQEPNGPGQLGSGQPPQNAVEASPTLAQMLEAQMQQAARERLESLQQAQSGQQDGDPSNPDASSPNPFSESGEGEMPAGGDDVDLIRGMIDDGDWGDLRRQSVDDAAQGRAVRIPPGYSREIKAYFKALSKRAAESKP